MLCRDEYFEADFSRVAGTGDQQLVTVDVVLAESRAPKRRNLRPASRIEDVNGLEELGVPDVSVKELLDLLLVHGRISLEDFPDVLQDHHRLTEKDLDLATDGPGEEHVLLGDVVGGVVAEIGHEQERDRGEGNYRHESEVDGERAGERA